VKIAVEKTCSHCKKEQPISCFYTSGKKTDGSVQYASWCKSCIKEKQASYHKKTWGKEKLHYVAFKRTKTARSYLAYLRSKANQRRLNEEVISLDALEVIWNIQGGNCAITGWPMTMELANGVVQTNCSIDRIDSSKGYVVGNVQLVCRAVNVAKSALSMSDFLNLCKAVVSKNGL
jgi:hypothetical protein